MKKRLFIISALSVIISLASWVINFGFLRLLFAVFLLPLLIVELVRCSKTIRGGCNNSKF